MNHNLEQIKQDYQNIKVPDALKQRVESSISQAKIDSERERIPRGFGGEKSKRAVAFSWFAK